MEDRDRTERNSARTVKQSRGEANFINHFFSLSSFVVLFYFFHLSLMCSLRLYNLLFHMRWSNTRINSVIKRPLGIQHLPNNRLGVDSIFADCYNFVRNQNWEADYVLSSCRRPFVAKSPMQFHKTAMKF